jgi:hypothetical protein
MKLKQVLSVVILSVSLAGLAQSAGGPMNEDLSSISIPTQKAIDAGKAGDLQLLIKEAEESLSMAKGKTDSASQQRIVGKLKRAISRAQAGNLAEAVQDLELSMTDMKKAPPPKFGGGS